MFTDIVFPKNNESQFIELAEKLGYSKLIFVYDKIPKKDFSNSSIKIETVLIKKPENCKQKSKDFILVDHSAKDRCILDKGSASLLFNLEKDKRKDFIHHRNSGLNQVHCKIAVKQKIKIGFSFSLILKSHNPGEIMGRMSQNIKLCRKYNVESVIASFAASPLEMRSPQDLISLFKILGMHPKEAKDSLCLLS